MATQTFNQKTTRSKAASPGRQILTQTQFELLLTLRRGENILVTLIVPVVLLIFFTSLNIVPAVNGSAVNFLFPGILALAVMAAGMVNLGIATAYERYYGVLKRLGSSPLPRSGLIIAKIISILLLEIVQVVLLVGVAILLYGWQPAGSPPLALLAMALGTVTFAAIGLAMAGAFPALYLAWWWHTPTESSTGPVGSYCTISACRRSHPGVASDHEQQRDFSWFRFSHTAYMDRSGSCDSHTNISMGVAAISRTHYRPHPLIRTGIVKYSYPSTIGRQIANDELWNTRVLKSILAIRYENRDTIIPMYLGNRFVISGNLVNDDFHAKAYRDTLLIEAQIARNNSIICMSKWIMKRIIRFVRIVRCSHDKSKRFRT